MGKSLSQLEATQAVAVALQRQITDLEHQRDFALRLLKGAICPCCDGSGAIIDERTIAVPRCCGHYRENGDCCLEPEPVQELEQQISQCQWCYERNAIFVSKDGK